MPLVLGVDSSARSTVVEVREAETGTLVASGRAPHPAAAPPRCEQEPSAWWQALLDAVRRTGQRDIAAIAVAGQEQGVVVIDGAGAVLRPAKLADDTEARPQARRMVRDIGAANWASATGSVPTAAFPVAKLAWLAAEEPSVLERAGKVLLPHDWLTFRLTGRAVTDRGDASATGYYSTRLDRWRPDVLRWVDGATSETEWLDRLPTVLAPSGRADWMAAPVHEKVGLRGRPIVAAGTGRRMAHALGDGIRPGQVAMHLGASAAVSSVADAPTADPSGAVVGFADATGRFLPTTVVHGGAALLDTVAGLLGVGAPEFDDLALQADAGAGGITVRPGPRSGIDGLPADARRVDLARAAVEGVVCAALDGLDRLVGQEVTLREFPIVLTGAGARSVAVRQALADLSGREVVVPDGEHQIALGACVQATAALFETPPERVIQGWELGAGSVTEPDDDVDAAEIRERFAAAAVS